MIGIEIVKDKENLISFEEKDQITDKIVKKGIEKGVLFYPGGTGEYRDIICLGPPYIISDDEIDLISETLSEVLNSIQAEYN